MNYVPCIAARIQIGSVYDHPEHGPIYITGGTYQDRNRISNFWDWQKVNLDGSLDTKQLCGYGGDWPKIEATVTTVTTVEFD